MMESRLLPPPPPRPSVSWGVTGELGVGRE